MDLQYIIYKIMINAPVSAPSSSTIIGKIKSVCDKYNQPMPTEMKLVYEPKTKKFNGEYKYENQTTDEISVFDNYDVSIIIEASVSKFKVSRPDVEFVLDIDKKSVVFRGTADMWEAIIDNILNNFIRYAKKKIKIVVKNNKIILYNDGENIDENVLENIFTPYEKGVNGVFGLGLSIVKKTLRLLNYDINIENVKNGVKFIIY